MSNFTKTVTEKFFKAINDNKMLESADNVVVGFSGGADSVCLLHLLNTFQDELDVKIKAVHVNHGIRGNEAKRDADFAKSFCDKFKISFRLVCVDCIGESELSKETLEECGRRLRYKSFNRFCENDSVIATAHNANDNAETILFNLARGTSLKGVCGIPTVRDNIIRPLILCTRQEIEGYCTENNLDFVTDSTNLSDDYTRNKIRHKVLPVLEEINSALYDNISVFSESVNKINEAFSRSCKKQYELLNKNGVLPKDKLLELDEATVREIIKIAFSKAYEKSLSNQKIKELYSLLVNGGRLQIYGDIFAESVKNDFRFFSLNQVDFIEETPILELPFEYKSFDYPFTLEKFENSSKKFNRWVLDNSIDCDRINGNIVVRGRKQGDSFTFSKRRVTKSLKKLFSESGIPVEKRSIVPVLSDDSGVVWVYGFGVNERCRVTEKTKNIIIIGGMDNDK